MSKLYRVRATSYIGGRLVQPGDVIRYDGKPGRFLELVAEPKGEKVKPDAPSDHKSLPGAPRARPVEREDKVARAEPK